MDCGYDGVTPEEVVEGLFGVRIGAVPGAETIQSFWK